MPCFFLRFFLGAGSGFFSSDSTLRFSSGAAGRALCNREDCVAPGLRAYCVKDVKVTSERFNSLVLQRFDYFFFLILSLLSSNKNIHTILRIISLYR